MDVGVAGRRGGGGGGWRWLRRRWWTVQLCEGVFGGAAGGSASRGAAVRGMRLQAGERLLPWPAFTLPSTQRQQSLVELGRTDQQRLPRVSQHHSSTGPERKRRKATAQRLKRQTISPWSPARPLPGLSFTTHALLNARWTSEFHTKLRAPLASVLGRVQAEAEAVTPAARGTRLRPLRISLRDRDRRRPPLPSLTHPSLTAPPLHPTTRALDMHPSLSRDHSISPYQSRTPAPSARDLS